MKRLTQFFLIITLLAAMLAGCATPTATPTALPATNTPEVVVSLPTATATVTPEPIQVTDDLGRSLTLAVPAQKIISLAPSATEILFAVGAGRQVVGRDSFSNYPEEATTLQDVGGSMGSYSIETIASLNPDLVLATEINTPELVKALEDLGITVYYLKNPIQLDGLYPMLEIVGVLTGHADEAAELVKSLKARVQVVVDAVSKADTQPLVFYELDGSDPSKPWTAGPGTFMELLIQTAGGVNVGSSMQDAWAQISLEELLVQNPDIILLGDAAYGMTPEQVAARTGWEGLQAVQKDQVFSFNDDLASRPGPRLVDALEELVRLIHPELVQ